ncbi:MAG TPA: hypothetical protein PLF30_03060 [Candidatus Moranbacteria bacterium]|jgi:hypothetical protein|nr:hypothetical protein [Candidatus Moranbacteria bacterium]
MLNATNAETFTALSRARESAAFSFQPWESEDKRNIQRKLIGRNYERKKYK